MTASIAIEDPRGPGAARLVGLLDAYMTELYPAESNHLLPLERLAGRDVTFLVARISGQAVGCGALIHHPAGFGEIKRIFTDPAWRGHGIARALVTRLVDAATRAGHATVRLETGTLQPEALALFRASGFEQCGAFAEYPADDPYSVFMVRPLESRFSSLPGAD